jgi:L-lactate dehydrogenase (cytochrome)
LTAKNALDIATKPAWAAGVLFGKRRTFGNLAARPGGAAGLSTLSQWIAGQFDPAMSWSDIEEIRKVWSGKLILKGVLDVEDARLAAATGADAIVEAVGDKVEVLFDGGVQSGQDVLKALALGARACLIGKAFLYALAAGGQAGVRQAIDLIGRELSVSMALTGVGDVTKVDSSVLRDPV